MSAQTGIEWTDATWNPVRGCTRVSEGCRNCYAEVMAARFSKPGQWGHGFAEIVTRPGGGIDHRWTGKVALAEDKLEVPLRWKHPRRIFVNSTSDLFHENLPDEAIDRIFAVMALCPQHTFQILTKRPERMREYFAAPTRRTSIAHRVWDIGRVRRPSAETMPLPNVWLGTSCEDQAAADARIPHLLATPAAIRFLSIEPMLGLIDLIKLRLAIPIEGFTHFNALSAIGKYGDANGQLLNWVICGGESGPGARPMHPDWARLLRDQCTAAGVPFFFKQWGEWAPCLISAPHDPDCEHVWPDKSASLRTGKKRAGRLLDGIEHNGFPASEPSRSREIERITS